MRKFRKASNMVALFAASFWSFSLVAHASNDAVSDILNNNRYNGAIQSISKFTTWFDDKMIMIISFFSFMLISFSILQNVVAAVCLAYPKFWQKVHQAHQQKSFGAALLGLAGGAKGMFQRGQNGGGGMAPGMNTTGGNGSMLLSFIPDLLAMTDLGDVEMTAKQYFAKSLPKMFLGICVGIFIYNGYYRDSASLIGGMGSEVVERMLGSVSPESFVNKITNTTAKPSSIYEASTDRKGRNAYALADAIYTSVVGNVDSGAVSLTSAEKTQIMRQAEASAVLILENHRSWFNYDKKLEYSLSVKSRFVTGASEDNYSSQYGITSQDSWTGTQAGDFSGMVFIPAGDFKGIDDYAKTVSDFGGIVLAISGTAKDWDGTDEAEFVQPTGDITPESKTYSLEYSMKMSTVTAKVGNCNVNNNGEIIGATPDAVAKAVTDIITTEFGDGANVTMKSGPAGASATAVRKQDIVFTVTQKRTINSINVDCTFTVTVKLADNGTDKWNGDNPAQAVGKSQKN